MLADLKLQIQSKPFAIGLRIEHPQTLIDKIQYGQYPRDENLPAAAYQLATNIDGRGVYSFCMCPGGLIVPAATAPGEIVVNGMSMSRRDSQYANAGLVVSVKPDDWEALGYSGPLGGLSFQADLEKKMYEYSENTMRAPAQRLIDFLNGIPSEDLPGTSYIPGLVLAPLHDLLPETLYHDMVEGIISFESKMKGYINNEAIVVGLESRTSSPVRIPRDKITFMHPGVEGLYPCGEGAGYAGGIVSAAIDGQLVIRAMVEKDTSN